ncbi:hypothetical protein [Aliterella atlantica]|uniref:hypothetical protein n=1 Tax=Aliterella atlantica TaxID=1827278 RepID=UPI00191067C9|nr:hypothetical protein [Aliterella atlantica]
MFIQLQLRHDTNRTGVERSHLDKAKIYHVIGIDGTTLIVFYTEAHCWQFRLISPGETVFGECKIYGEC